MESHWRNEAGHVAPPDLFYTPIDVTSGNPSVMLSLMLPTLRVR
jgi:hypothetical protein